MQQTIKQKIELVRKGKVPEGWTLEPLKNILKPVSREVPKPDKPYWRLGLRSHAKGTFHELVENPDSVAMDKLFVVKENDLVVNITFAWEHAIEIASKKDDGKLVSHRFPTYTFKEGNSPDFFKYVIRTQRFKYDLGVASPGGAGRNRVLSKTEFLEIKVPCPPYKEQVKIAKMLLKYDEYLSLLNKRVKLEKQRKKWHLNKLLKKEICFNIKEEWYEKKIIDLLKYEQPDKYISNEIIPYDKKLIPVLTANKSFILGSTKDKQGIYKDIPVIIFDDFTTNKKYVDFPFKVRSSALKILSPKTKDVNLKYVFELMMMLKFVLGDHKRYYISEYQHIKVKIPSIEVQNKIADFSKLFDKKILLLNNFYLFNKNKKNFMTQQLLNGIIRVEVN